MFKTKEELDELYEGLELLLQDTDEELTEAHTCVMEEIQILSQTLKDLDDNEYASLKEDFEGDLTVGDILNEDPVAMNILQSMGGQLKGGQFSGIVSDPASSKFGFHGSMKNGNASFGNKTTSSGYSPFSLASPKGYSPVSGGYIDSMMRKNDLKNQPGIKGGIFKLIHIVKNFLSKIVISVMNMILGIGNKLFGMGNKKKIANYEERLKANEAMVKTLEKGLERTSGSVDSANNAISGLAGAQSSMNTVFQNRLDRVANDNNMLRDNKYQNDLVLKDMYDRNRKLIKSVNDQATSFRVPNRHGSMSGGVS